MSSVLSDLMGKSGVDILENIVLGVTDPQSLADCAKGRLKAKREELILSLEGHVTDHHRFMLAQHLKQIRFIEQMDEIFSRQIEDKIKSQGEEFAALIPLLTTVSGIDQRSGEELLAEIGANMNQFPTSANLCSWAGMCPGNNESAGKRKSGKTTNGSRWLRATLGEIAWGAARTKNTYLSTQFKRIAKRRGKKKAIVAVGHTVLTTVYYIIKNRVSYHELGGDYYEKVLNRDPSKWHIKNSKSSDIKSILKKKKLLHELVFS